MLNDCLHLELGNSEVGPRSSQKAEAAHKLAHEAGATPPEAARVTGIPNEVSDWNTTARPDDIVVLHQAGYTTHDLHLLESSDACGEDRTQDNSSWLSAALLELEAIDAAVAPSAEHFELSDWKGDDCYEPLEAYIVPGHIHDWSELATPDSFDEAAFGCSSSPSHHKGQELSQDDRHCFLCDRDFKYAKDFRRHIRSVHNDERPYKCPVNRCKYQYKGFAREDNRKRHMSRMHPGVSQTMDMTFEL